MATDEAVELAPDAQDDGDVQDDENRVERLREWVRRGTSRLPRPTPPSAQDALYAYTVLLLVASPAVAVAGTTWFALVEAGVPVAVAAAGVGMTAYALFLLVLIVRYERSRTVTPEG